MGTRRCMNCMNEKSEEERYCPFCGADSQRIEQPNYALGCNTLLHERYLIGRVLGQGGFGITYVGLDVLLNLKVAVKEYFPMGSVTRDSGTSRVLWNPSQASQSQRQNGYDSFLKEARKMARIDGIPSIVRVRDLFLDNETAYIVMDFAEGVTLKQKLSQDGPMAFSQCMELLLPMMEDLATVHKQGMIHRDISPDNIIIRENGKVCLLDFGAAKDMTTSSGITSQVVAKKGFSPLEQYTDAMSSGPWTDVYALCATIYYCITGRMAPSALERIDHEEITFPDEMIEPLAEKTAETLAKGLAVRPEQRIRDMEELLGCFKEEKGMPLPKKEIREEKAAKPAEETVREEQKNSQDTPKETSDLQMQPPQKREIRPKELPELRVETRNGIVFGKMGLARAKIFSITFVDTLENMPEDAWDVSARQNGTVMAWTEQQGRQFRLFIGGEGGVRAPQNCQRMFANYNWMLKLDFNGSFDTSQAVDMRGMFLNCGNLRQLDLSELDLTQVVDARGMFQNCRNLRQLDVRGLNLAQANTDSMFFNCRKDLEVRGMDRKQATNNTAALIWFMVFFAMAAWFIIFLCSVST